MGLTFGNKYSRSLFKTQQSELLTVSPNNITKMWNPTQRKPASVAEGVDEAGTDISDTKHGIL